MAPTKFEGWERGIQNGQAERARVRGETGQIFQFYLEKANKLSFCLFWVCVFPTNELTFGPYQHNFMVDFFKGAVTCVLG